MMRRPEGGAMHQRSGDTHDLDSRSVAS